MIKMNEQKEHAVIIETKTHEVATDATLFFQNIIDRKTHIIGVEDMGGMVKVIVEEGEDPKIENMKTTIDALTDEVGKLTDAEAKAPDKSNP